MSEEAIWDILNQNLFFIKNAVKRSEAKTSDKLNVYDPESQQLLLECREPDIGILTKAARLIGGGHDVGTAFNLVASIPGSKEQALRVARGNASLSLGGPAVRISDHWDSLIGTFKKKNWALGMKFAFSPQKQGEPFVLQLKGGEIYRDSQRVAGISKSDSQFFRENRFDYAFAISQEVPANSQLRQILLALAIAKERIII